MSFSINTNVASLSAQNYLRINSNFQGATINRVTSGLRIVQSGDDAAGLAIANGLRSDQSVLTQGVRNANDGLSQLQIIDGGMNNISQLLDRARTLATQSGSGTFTGDRSVLNGEFQSVLGEINRQAQSIGLNQGGTFAKSLQVFIGGGKGATAQDIINNGSVGVNLSASTVDAKSLGLQGVQALGGAAGTDIGPGAAKTSVQAILGDTQNTASEAVTGFSQFNFYGPGFSDVTGSNVVKVSVNLSGVSDATTLAAAVNQAIQNAGNAGSQQATAFKNANITASVVSDANGHQQLAFNSSSAAFQVQGADRVANAVLGQFVDTTSVSHPALGVSPDATVTSGTYSNAATGGTYKLRLISSAYAAGYHDFDVTVTAADTRDKVLADVQTAIAGNTAGVTVKDDGSNHLQFSAPAGQSFQVQVAGDVTGDLGLGTWQKNTTLDYSTITGAAYDSSGTDIEHLQISAGGTSIDLGTFAAGATETAALASLNTAFLGNSTLRALGVNASDSAGSITIASSAGANFRLNAYGATAGGTDDLGFIASTSSASSTADFTSTVAAKTSVNSGGAYASVNGGTGTGVADVYAYQNMLVSTDKQTISLSATDASGAQHTLNVALTGGFSGNGYNVDSAVAAINSTLQQSNDPVMKGIVAVKERTASNSSDGIRFMSAANNFSVSLGATADPIGTAVGISDNNTGGGGVAQGEILASTVQGTGATADISSQATASAAVSALSAAVSSLGKSQAVVGRGENQFNYAVNLAQSQLTNLATAESRIRDADLAAEAANLTKAQILIQAGVAALAQANSAPQQVLSLLR